MLKIPWVAKRINNSMLEEANALQKKKTKILTQQTKLFGHVVRRKEYEYNIIKAKP